MPDWLPWLGSWAIVSMLIVGWFIYREFPHEQGRRYSSVEQASEQGRILEQKRPEEWWFPPQESEQWWVWYNTYLQSPEWRARRVQVLERDGYVCQICRKAPAQQVHHLSYANVGHEPLWDLQAVCVNCHEELHGQ